MSAMPFDDIRTMARHTKFVVLSLVSDLDAANGRLKLEMGRRAVEHNREAARSGQCGMVLILDARERNVLCFC
eukprot:11156269-Lingulodinium_polyedra.AAC.1